ncbi:MAG TPA: hypothetical protein VFK78_10790 [Gemmatimonadales bacterium]|nr:hypothetical protein [Gemmatimonadales bacterium]
MRWRSSLLASLAAAAALAARGGDGTLRFDLSGVRAERDSFIYKVDGTDAGYEVWQYQPQPGAVVFTQVSELGPVFSERSRVILDRATGLPTASYQHTEFFSPATDTVFVEHDLHLSGGRLRGSRRIGTKEGKIRSGTLDRRLRSGTVWSGAAIFMAPFAALSPGDSVSVAAYDEADDTLTRLSMRAGPEDTVTVPAGHFTVVPISTGGLTLLVSTGAARRVVRALAPEQHAVFDLAGTGPPVSPPPAPPPRDR